jgi:hypothetical protein
MLVMNFGLLPHFEQGFDVGVWTNWFSMTRRQRLTIPKGKLTLGAMLRINMIVATCDDTGRLGPLQEVPRPSDFNDPCSGDHGSDQFALWGGMDLVRMVRTDWFGHEHPDAIIQSALGYQIGATTISGTNPFIPHRSHFRRTAAASKLIGFFVLLII